MKILLITEKYNPDNTQRDGGARLVETLKEGFGDKLSIMQFSSQIAPVDNIWSFRYPIELENRFKKRLANAEFIAQQVNAVINNFTHVLFVHVSMQFKCFVPPNLTVWTFPMFLTPSYQLSGEIVPLEYTEMEKMTLMRTKKILTPSYFEKKQLIKYYGILEEKIHIIPRGINQVLFKPMTFKLKPKDSPIFCSIGSIKPQKNTLELVNWFWRIQKKYQKALLYIIGPVQNQHYYQLVQKQIQKLNLNEKVKLLYYQTPERLSELIKDCHIHISAANCETFGRAIFETLAAGIPNIVQTLNNASYDFLQNLPYVQFVSSYRDVLPAVEKILLGFDKLSSIASEIGYLYDDKRLSKLMIAKICNKDSLIISDYDGTLFHKECYHTTQGYIKKFKQFSPRIICSARSTEDLLEEIIKYDLKVDWIISYSGAVIADGKGNILYTNPISQTDLNSLNQLSKYSEILVKGQIIQVIISSIDNNSDFHLNVEVYHDKKYLSNWHASKLYAICKLLDHLNWEGNIVALGDSQYDLRYLKYFDGYLINNKKLTRFSNTIKEVINDSFIL